MFCSIKEN